MLKESRRNDEEVINVFMKAVEIAKAIQECKREYNGFLTGVSGRFVEPGPSGSLTRGKMEILPTGRNFYAVDPTSLPTPAAWRIGVETARKLLNKYYRRHKRYPETVGQVLWSIDGYKADGEQLAQILYLIGVKPKWKSTNQIERLELIPLDELNRPRIDVIVRISGILRDTLPNYINLIDEAISLAICVDEPFEKNYVRKHYFEYIQKLVELGKNREEAEELARYRIFGSPPGSYGAGVNYAIEASAWNNDEDLAKTWIQWSCYVYSSKIFGKQCPETLMLEMKSVDVVTRNHISDEHDILNCCCYFAYHGGFYNTAKVISGKKDLEVVTIDTRDISFTEVRDMKMEIERIVRSKLLNPIWISEMKKHGYSGASEFSRKILHLYGWSATTKLVDNWIFNEISKIYVLDDEMREWFKEHNIYALEEIIRRLLEAANRGLWQAPIDIYEKLREIYGEVESIFEESILSGDEIQGGAIKIYTMDDVKSWKSNVSEVINAWKKLKEGE